MNQWYKEQVISENKQDRQTLMQTNKKRQEKTSKLTQSEIERDKWQQTQRKYTESLVHTKETCIPHNWEKNGDFWG